MTLGLFINAVCFLALFYIIELKSPEPILPLNLFKLPMVMIPNLAIFFLCTVLIGMNVYLPMWVQGVLGYKATGSGIALIPMSVGWTLGAFYCGKLLISIGIRNTTSLGAGAILAGCILLAVMGLSIFKLIFGMFIIGLGFGLAMTSSGIVIQSSVEWNLRGSATALFTFTQALGQTVGVAMLGVLFYHTISAGSVTLNREVLTLGLHNIFIALSVISVLGLFVNLLIPNQKLLGSKQP